MQDNRSNTRAILSRIFLVGCPRSGTTLTQSLLAAHPMVASFPESHFFSHLLVHTSVISAYYYLRVVKVMWLGEPASEEKVPSSGALRTALALSCLGVLLLGVIPGFATGLAEIAANIFTF